MKFSSRLIDDHVISLSELSPGSWSMLYRHPHTGEMCHHKSTSAKELLWYLRNIVRSVLTDVSVTRYERDLINALHRVHPFFDTQPNGTLLWCNRVDTNAYMAMRKIGKTDIRISVVLWRGVWAWSRVEVPYAYPINVDPLIEELERRLSSTYGKLADVAPLQQVHDDVYNDRGRHHHFHGASAPMDEATRTRIRTKLGISEGILARHPRPDEVFDPNNPSSEVNVKPSDSSSDEEASS